MKQTFKINNNLDKHLKQLKTEKGEKSSLELATEGNGARISGDLEVTGYTDNIKLRSEATIKADGNVTLDSAGDISLDADGGEIRLKDGGTQFGTFSTALSISQLKLFEAAGASDDDNFAIAVLTNGATNLSTVDAAGTDADLTLNVDGDITLDSATGVFIMKNDGDEFSVENSAYAGMILGYTRIANDATTTNHNVISIDTSMTVLETASGTECKVTFVAPPSGNVEIQFQAMFGSQDIFYLSVSTAADYAEHDESHTYDNFAVTIDESDRAHYMTSFAITGLDAGTTYNRWIAGAVSSGTGNILHGRNRSTGTHAPPIIIKAIALPATITTGE